MEEELGTVYRKEKGHIMGKRNNSSIDRKGLDEHDSIIKINMASLWVL